jgi:hypothetical protein
MSGTRWRYHDRGRWHFGPIFMNYTATHRGRSPV